MATSTIIKSASLIDTGITFTIGTNSTYDVTFQSLKNVLITDGLYLLEISNTPNGLFCVVYMQNAYGVLLFQQHGWDFWGGNIVINENVGVQISKITVSNTGSRDYPAHIYALRLL